MAKTNHAITKRQQYPSTEQRVFWLARKHTQVLIIFCPIAGLVWLRFLFQTGSQPFKLKLMSNCIILLMSKGIFVLIMLTNILINLDHGILPACTNEVMDYYNINQYQLGILGSIVYLGIIIMGLYVGRLYQKVNSKLMCLIGLVCLIGSLFLFVMSKIFWLAVASRFLTGVFQVFMLVYFPVWIDKFGGDSATTWLTLLQVGVPLGIFAGYAMTALIIRKYTWKYSFYIQIGVVAISIVVFFLMKARVLDVKNLAIRKSSFEDHILIKQGPVKKKPTYFQLLFVLLKTKMYIISVLTMSVMLFVSTGIQFWMTNYFTEVLSFTQTQVNIAYAVVSITGPTLGAGFGGFVTNYIGGYANPRTIYFIFAFSAVGMTAAVIIPFVDNFWPVCILLWIVLFFGGAMVPGLTGMIMASIPSEVRSFGNSKAQIVKNSFGYFPSPFLYGLVNNASSNPRAGMMLIMFWGLMAPILLGIGSIFTFIEGKKALQVQDIFTVGSQGGSLTDPLSPDLSPRRNENILKKDSIIESDEAIEQPDTIKVEPIPVSQ